MNKLETMFDLTGRVAVITGGTGLLGQQHAEAIAFAGGIPVLADISVEGIDPLSESFGKRFGQKACVVQADITNLESVKALKAEVLKRFGRVDILINNAANNPKMEKTVDVEFSRLENFPLSSGPRIFQWG